MLFKQNVTGLLYREAKKLPLMIWFYTFGIGLLTLFLSFITPSMKGIDEPSHFFRALQVSEGHLLATKYSDNVYGGDINSKMSLYAIYAANNKTVDKKAIEDFEKIPEKDVVRNVFSTSATYSPVMYIPLASGLFIGKELNLSINGRYMLGKILNVVFCTALLCLLILILPYGKYFTLFFLTTPSIITMAAYYNVDTFVNLLAVIFIACCIRAQVMNESNRLLKYSIIILAISLGLLKITYCFFSLLVLILPPRLFKSKTDYFSFITITILLSVLPAMVWNYFYKFTPGAVFHTQNDPTASLQMLIHHPLTVLGFILHTLRESTYTWSCEIYNRYVNANGLLVVQGYTRYFFTFCLLLSFFVEKKIYEPAWKTGFKIILSLTYCLIIFLAFYIGFSEANTPFIGGIQVRYFIVPIILLALAIQCLVPNRYIFEKFINPLLIANFLCILYVIFTMVPAIIS